jgi:hypothetical protein
MEWTEFVPLALRTESNLFDTSYRRLNHAVLGLITEYFEYQQDNGQEELGDSFWYCALAFDYLRAVPMELEGNLINQDTCLMELADGVKRVQYYGKFDVYKFYKHLNHYWNHLMRCDKRPDTLEKVIAKLRVRYPDKFDSTRAVERDLDKEQDIYR